MKKQILLFLIIVLLSGCKEEFNSIQPTPLTKPQNQARIAAVAAAAAPEVYIPQELSSNDFNNSASTWSWSRSRSSDHFIVFWAKPYGSNDPNSTAVPAAYRVNITDLLSKAEGFFQLNVTQLGFANLATSKLNRYKMMIFINYQTEWLATGSGYDNVIGALWVSPATMQPVGHVIGHEIGHCFQYQVFADQGVGGFRYGFGGNGGNGFWEQTANFQGFQSYPSTVFTAYDFTVYKDNYHRHVHHEWYRYASYFILYYWEFKRGRDFVGKLWRESRQPEDPIQAYMRLNGINVATFNGEIYDQAVRFVTWDIPSLRTYGTDYHGAQTWNYTRLTDGSYQVAYNRAPGTTGYNVIPLTVPAAGTVVSTVFTGMVNAPGYNQVANPARAGWRHGYVALLNTGERRYSGMWTNNATSSFTVPAGTVKLWYVVTGAPTTYAPHPWDENEANDDQWPYKVKFTNSSVL
ncbi:DUF6055 domain-containing protein [Pedobacter sp. P26]|uniref:DUF6055 domain-containing protein n=1 Tax=Pedobacter sp. P26 TaxID=3423956 RepID=UPI003D67F0C5